MAQANQLIVLDDASEYTRLQTIFIIIFKFHQLTNYITLKYFKLYRRLMDELIDFQQIFTFLTVTHAFCATNNNNNNNNNNNIQPCIDSYTP